MIPYSYKFVDFGGTDLSEINGKVVEGIHDRIIAALNQCGEVILYNWYFAAIPISPSYCTIEVRPESLIVNGVVEIRDDDTVWVESLIPPEPEPPEPPPPPVLVPLEVTENGEYDPSDYDADGFSSVSVDVATAASYRATRVWTQSVSGTYAALNVQEGIVSDLSFTPTSEVINVLYTSVQPTERLFEQIGVRYQTRWIIRALEKLYYSLSNDYLDEDGTISWAYSESKDYIFYFKEE